MTYDDDVSALLGLAASADHRVRGAVAAALIELPHRPDIDTALGELLTDQRDTYVMERAIVACARAGARGWRLICANPPTGEHADHCEEHRHDAFLDALEPDWMVRRPAREALADLVAEDADAGVRQEAMLLIESLRSAGLLD